MKTLYQNGLIVDGTGSTPFVGDVLVENNRIVKIGTKIADDVDKIVNCTGLTIAPGFIDSHSHNDFYCGVENSEMYYQSFIKQGITTQITGNCGFSPFGVANDCKNKDLIGGGIFRAKHAGTFKDWIAAVKDDLYVNIVPLVGHSTTRVGISGFNSAPLTKEQIDEEIKLVDEAMENGAYGGSFGFMYEPGMYAKPDELYAFASEIAKYDGIVTVHARALSKVSMDYPLLGKPHLERALDEVIDIMEKCKCRMEFSHLLFAGEKSWPSAGPMLKKFHEYNEKGYDLGYDMYSFTYGASVITLVMPAWYLGMSEEDKKKPFNLFKLKIMVNISKIALGLDWSDFMVAYIGPGYEKYEGRYISDIAKEEGLSDFDEYIKLVDLSKGQGRLYIGKYYSDEMINTMMNDDLSIYMTDAWIEENGTQNGSAFQCFPYFLVRAKENNMKLEKVVRKMSGAIVDRYLIPERGYIKEGYFADLTIFDYDNIVVKPTVPDFTPEGIKYVVINGKEVISNGEYKSAPVGTLILKDRK